MGAQGAPCSTAFESVAGGGQGVRESELADAQTRLMPDEPDNAPLTENERRGLERMLTDHYGIPWVLSALELDALREEEEDPPKVAMEPGLIFSLTVPDNVYPLPNVAETRLCRVNLGLGGVGVTGILDTGAQRSLLSATAYERVCSRLPPLMQPSIGAKRMVGASGASLTVIGELRNCPVLLNGYKYYANLVVTKLDTVDAILGMDFLKAYDVTIDLRHDIVSLGAGALIQQVVEEKSMDRVPVRLRADCSLLTGHLNRCRVQVDDATLSGVYLFEAGASSLRDALCQFEAQVVEVRNGLTELYVEHRGAGPSLRMRRGEVLGELRVLGATEVHTPKRSDPVNPCHALYALSSYPQTLSQDG